jgi:hypothetical protein
MSPHSVKRNLWEFLGILMHRPCGTDRVAQPSPLCVLAVLFLAPPCLRDSVVKLALVFLSLRVDPPFRPGYTKRVPKKSL